MTKINELSAKMLGHYIKKSKQSAMDAAAGVGHLKHKSPEFLHAVRLGKKRAKGINHAADKLVVKAAGNDVEKDMKASVADTFNKKPAIDKQAITDLLKNNPVKAANSSNRQGKPHMKLVAGKPVQAEAEVNELSKRTLGSYITKASQDAVNKTAAKKPIKAIKRGTGIDRAVMKLTKEDEVSEVEKKKMTDAEKRAEDMKKFRDDTVDDAIKSHMVSVVRGALLRHHMDFAKRQIASSERKTKVELKKLFQGVGLEGGLLDRLNEARSLEKKADFLYKEGQKGKDNAIHASIHDNDTTGQPKVKEDVNVVGSGNIAGVGVPNANLTGNQGDPPVATDKQRKQRGLKSRNSLFDRTKPKDM